MASSSSSSPFPVIKAVPRFADVAGNFNDGDLARWAAVAGGATLFGYGVGKGDKGREEAEKGQR